MDFLSTKTSVLEFCLNCLVELILMGPHSVKFPVEDK